MWRSYWTTGIRNLNKNKLTSLLNLLGLTLGLTCFILICLFINHELSYDQHFKDAESIYRLDYIKENDQLAMSPYRMAHELAEDFSEIEEYVRISTYDWTVQNLPDAYNETVYVADSNLLNMFDFPVLAGDGATALANPNSLVLSVEKARKFFGNSASLNSIIGKNLTIREQDFSVTAIIDIKSNPTTLPVDIVIPGSVLLTVNPDFQRFFMTTWFGASQRAYVRMKPNMDLQDFNQRVTKYVDERGKAQSPGRDYGVSTISLLDIHLYSKSRRGLVPNGSINVVLAYAAIGILILGLACINFMNLATAQASQRAKEVGVRKSLGAQKSQLVMQFLTEAVLLAVGSLVLALGLVYILLPLFGQLLAAEIEYSLFQPVYLLSVFILALLVGLVAGSYPALYLSSFKPAAVLKGNVNKSGGFNLRKVLIIFQFTIAVVLVISTLVINQQIELSKDVDLGYDRDNLVQVENVGDKFKTFREQLISHPDIDYVVRSHVVATETPRSPTIGRLPGQSSEQDIGIHNNFVSQDFFVAYGIDVVAGRVFSRKFRNDTYFEDRENPPNSRGNVVVNTELVKQMGMTPEQIIGQTISVGAISAPERLQVIGVVASSYYKSVHQPLKPMIYYLNGRQLPRTTIKINSDSVGSALQHIDRTWKRLSPGYPIARSFLDDDYNAQYLAEEKQSQLLTVFSVIAVLITCLGLFGLASFTAERRIKEIGIRKVLGASRMNITWLISSDFAKLVVFANALAWPVTFIIMNNWLQQFASRVDLNPLSFVAALVLTLLVALFTVGGLALKAASQKPINALRFE